MFDQVVHEGPAAPAQRIIGARIRDLEPIEQVDIALDPRFNVLYGLNGVGKSRLLHALSIDPSLTRSATIELHLSAPPGPVEPEHLERWLDASPGNPWKLMLGETQDGTPFPGVPENGPVAHLMIPVYEAARAILDRRHAQLPRHAQAVVFRLLEASAQTPQHLHELTGSSTLTRFVDAAVQVALDGRFIVRLDSGYLTLELAAERPDAHTTLSGIIAENRHRVLQSSGVIDVKELRNRLINELDQSMDWQDVDAPDDFMMAALASMLEDRWMQAALESCFHPLLRAGIPGLLEDAGVGHHPAWHAAPLLDVYVPIRLDETLGISILPEWRTTDLEELQRTTFAQLPPLLERIGGSTTPDRDFGIVASRDGRAVFETNYANDADVSSIEWLANSIYQALMDDAPQLEIIQRSPAGETRFFMWGLLDWTAIEPPDRRLHVSSLSEARRRWAQFSISLALTLRGSIREHGRLLIIDEPERGLHRTAERRLAAGLARLGRELDLTIVVATHSPSFLGLPGVMCHHLQRDARGRLTIRQLDGPLPDSHHLGLSHADRAQFLRAIVLVPDELDAAAFEGFIGGSAIDHGIIIRALPDIGRYQDSWSGELEDEVDDPDVVAVRQILEFTDAQVLICADESQLHFLHEASEEEGEFEEPWYVDETDDPDNPEVTEDTWAQLLALDVPGPAVVPVSPEGSPNERFEFLVGHLMRLMDRTNASNRAHFVPFERSDLLAALSFSKAFDFASTDATLLLARAWEGYYSRGEETDPVEGISNFLGEVIDAASVRSAAEDSDTVPDAVTQVLDLVLGTERGGAFRLDPYDGLRWDVPF